MMDAALPAACLPAPEMTMNERLRMSPMSLLFTTARPSANPAERVAPQRTRQRWGARLLPALVLGLGMAVLGALGTPQAQAQTRFGAALYVNNQAVTHYEIEQRARFLEFIGAGGGDLRAMARERLIEDRLQLQAARRAGLFVNADQIAEGKEEFAARAELTADQLTALLREAGVDPETFTDFIRAGVVWRDLINARFGPEVRVTEAQIDRALSVEAVRPVTEVLLSEIFLPSDPEFAEIVDQLIPQILEIRTPEEFSAAARQVSAAPTAPTGGRIERWIELISLPAPLQEPLAQAAMGDIIGPLEVPGAYAFFQLRARREVRDVPAGEVELEYRRLSLPGGRSESNLTRVAQLRAGVDSCNDLGGVLGRVAPELPDGTAESHTRRRPELSPAYATELSRLNPGELSANLVEGGDLVVLMLCARRVAPDPAPSREDVRMALFSRALEGLADAHLQMLRAEAEIRAN